MQSTGQTWRCWGGGRVFQLLTSQVPNSNCQFLVRDTRYIVGFGKVPQIPLSVCLFVPTRLYILFMINTGKRNISYLQCSKKKTFCTKAGKIFFLVNMGQIFYAALYYCYQKVLDLSLILGKFLSCFGAESYLEGHRNTHRDILPNINMKCKN